MGLTSPPMPWELPSRESPLGTNCQALEPAPCQPASLLVVEQQFFARRETQPCALAVDDPKFTCPRSKDNDQGFEYAARGGFSERQPHGETGGQA